jgi:hypothetical protein
MIGTGAAALLKDRRTGMETTKMNLLKGTAFVVLALVAFLLFCRGQGYEWTLGTDDEVKLIQARIAAQWSCFGRYDGTKEYDRVLRCQADAEKLIRDKFKWW